MPASHDDVDLITLAPGVAPPAFAAALQAQAPSLVGSLLTWLHDDLYALAPGVREVFAPQAIDAALQQAGATSNRQVAVTSFAQMVQLRDVRIEGTRLPPAGPVVVEPPTFSHDAVHQGQPIKLDWHTAVIGLPGAWAQLDAGGIGPGDYAAISVGHIDTGYTEHPALGWPAPWVQPARGKNFWKDRRRFGDNPARFFDTPEDPGPRDNLVGANGGHGTRTSGVLGGLYAPAVPAIAFPFFGAAPGVDIIPYRITDSVLIDNVPDFLADAVADAVAKGAQVLSISLGALFANRKVARAIGAAYQQGVIVCAAAGQVVRQVVYPGRYNCVITVGGATTSDGHKLHPWPNAARGTSVDVSGPADYIRRPTVVGRLGSERYTIGGPGDGTSFATALCAGIAVLWLARRGTELDAKYGATRWARVEAFRKLLCDTVLPDAHWDTANFGAGVFDADALLRAELPDLANLVQRSDQ